MSAAVLIVLGLNCAISADGSACNCQSPYRSTNAGTLTAEGIWTHDHYSGMDMQGNAIGAVAQNGQQAVAAIRNYDCMEIRGKSGTFAVPCKNIPSASRGVSGAMLIPYGHWSGGIERIGALVSMSMTPGMEDLTSQFVNYAYISGNNYECGSSRPENPVGGQYCGWDRLRLGTALVGAKEKADLRDLGGTVVVLQREQYKMTSWFGEETAPGDSGAGVFIGDRLIGVVQGGTGNYSTFVRI